MIKVGVIGCGYWGPKLVRNFDKVEGFDIAGVADLDQRRLDSIKQDHPSVRVTTDPQELLSDSQIDALAIATPISTHYKLAREALMRGKHVLVEKPMTITTSQAEELVEIAEQKKRVLMIDATFIYTGAVKKMKEIIESGELGDIYYIDSVRVNLGRLGTMGRATGFYHDVNVVWDLAPHDISIMNFLLDKRPISATAQGQSYINYGADNHESVVYGTINFEDGILGHFHVSWLAPQQVKRTVIVGSKKMLVYDDLDRKSPVKVYDKGVRVENHGANGISVQYREGNADVYVPEIDPAEALEVEVRHFLDCIENRKESITNGRVGLAEVRMLEAIQRSLKNGGAVIEL